MSVRDFLSMDLTNRPVFDRVMSSMTLMSLSFWNTKHEQRKWPDTRSYLSSFFCCVFYHLVSLCVLSFPGTLLCAGHHSNQTFTLLSDEFIPWLRRAILPIKICPLFFPSLSKAFNAYCLSENTIISMSIRELRVTALEICCYHGLCYFLLGLGALSDIWE